MTFGLRAQHSARVGLVIALGLLMGSPFYWLVITALKTPQEAIRFPPTWIPTEIRWQNISDAMRLLGDVTFLNSLIFTVSVTFLQLVLVICAGFAFAKMRVPAKNFIFNAMIATVFVPFHVVLVPTFLVTRQFDWIDSWPGLVVPIVAHTAFGTFLFRQFFQSLPNELIEAARIDGASWGQIFRLIAVPLAGPPAAAYVSITTLNAWNMYVWPLIVIYDKDLRVLPLALAAASGDYNIVTANVKMMAVLITTLPTFLAFVLAQKYFVAGLGGAIKE
jgi:ABC-type glycerol-3-phosphate transport system permease component